jgi:hypothetical protein
MQLKVLSVSAHVKNRFQGTHSLEYQRECISINVSSSSIILHQSKELLKCGFLLNLKPFILRKDQQCHFQFFAQNTHIENIQDIISGTT